MNDMTLPAAATPAALTLPERAAKAFDSAKLELELAALVKVSMDVVEVLNADGREQLHRMGMNLKNARREVEKKGDAVRKDATAFGKSITVEEDRLLAALILEEDRVFALRDGWDTKVANERKALVDAEVARMSAIEAAIEGIKERGASAAGMSTSTLMQTAIDDLVAFEVTAEAFAERFDLAVATKAMVLSAMRLAKITKVEAETEAKRVLDDRAELERLRKLVADSAPVAAAVAAVPAEDEPEQMAAAAPTPTQVSAPKTRKAFPFTTERNQAMGVERLVLDPAAAWPKAAVTAVNAQASLIDDLPDHTTDPDDEEIIQLMAATYNMTVDQVHVRLVRLVDALVERQ